jgi:hypothetical protein
VERLFDPQYYAGHNIVSSEPRLGRLTSCDEYRGFFRQRRRRELESDPELIRQDIINCLQFQNGLDLTGLIAPNIVISRSFDSIEANIRLDQKSNGEHLRAIYEGLRIFAELAELDTAALDS